MGNQRLLAETRFTSARSFLQRIILSESDPVTLLRWLRQPPTNNWIINYLTTHQLLPTAATVDALERGTNLEEMMSSIHDGKFDLENPLHKELEYARYLFQSIPGDSDVFPSRKWMSKEYFDKLPWIEGKDVVFNDYDREWIDKTAREAATVFQHIEERKANSTSPLLVIANKRYGSYFVIKPIEELLQAQGIHVVHEYVSSYDLDLRGTDKWYPSVKTSNIIETENPEIIVVDGTKNSMQDDLMRFPAAILGYLNTFREDYPEKYHFSFWSPQMTSPFVVGNQQHQQKENISAKREVLFICSTAWGIDYSMAYFDDPEDYIRISRNEKKMRLGFTMRGITVAPIAPNVDRFVEEVQWEMKVKIREYLKI